MQLEKDRLLSISHPSVEINRYDNERYTLLNQATSRGDIKRVDILLKHAKSDTHQVDRYGRTPQEITALLLLACSESNEEYTTQYQQLTVKFQTIAALLQSYQEAPMKALHDDNTKIEDIDDDEGPEYESLLHLASRIGDTATVSFLVDNNLFDVNIRNNNGSTPLHVACVSGHHECVKLLLSVTGIKVNTKEKSGTTPLHLAAYNNHSECVKLLLNVDEINTNPQTNDGITPLHFAAQEGSTRCLSLLLAKDDTVRLTYKNLRYKNHLRYKDARGPKNGTNRAFSFQIAGI